MSSCGQLIDEPSSTIRRILGFRNIPERWALVVALVLSSTGMPARRLAPSISQRSKLKGTGRTPPQSLLPLGIDIRYLLLFQSARGIHAIVHAVFNHYLVYRYSDP